MSFVGILTENRHESYLKQELKEKIPQDQILFLKENSIENLRNIKFQTLLIGKSIKKNKEVIREIAKKVEYLIVNTDIVNDLTLLQNLNIQLITYGFKSKATITASSIEEGKMIVFLQRGIKNVYGTKIEPQELEMNFSQEINSYAVMEAISLLLLYKI